MIRGLRPWTLNRSNYNVRIRCVNESVLEFGVKTQIQKVNISINSLSKIFNLFDNVNLMTGIWNSIFAERVELLDSHCHSQKLRLIFESQFFATQSFSHTLLFLVQRPATVHKFKIVQKFNGRNFLNSAKKRLMIDFELIFTQSKISRLREKNLISAVSYI